LAQPSSGSLFPSLLLFFCCVSFVQLVPFGLIKNPNSGGFPCCCSLQKKKPMRQEKVARKKHTHSTQTLFTRNWPF
jgi:hypothetical protein